MNQGDTLREYPRVLIVALGRINAEDNFNNGLLLRNLFALWPREHLAQIYSSGDNGDCGFFGHYYQLGPQDRWFGKVFYRLKAEVQDPFLKMPPKVQMQESGFSVKKAVQSLGKRWFMDTGLYELIFRPRLSRAMVGWIERFKPNVIFVQGYNLTFTWLPLMIAERFQIPIVYYPTDDWPSDLYCSSKIGVKYFMHKSVQRLSSRLVELAALRIAFNPLMQSEYQARYRKDFIVLMHGDSWERFASIASKRLYPEDVHWIVSTGVFDEHRMPLLDDLEKACEILSARNLQVRATIFPVNYYSINPGEFRYLDFRPCPSHEELPAFLKGADVLFLPERFDESVEDIRLCVSSKAHLFMFSRRPVVVYADYRTGIARYALQEGWAIVVGQRDPSVLASSFQHLFEKADGQNLVSIACSTIEKYHELSAIQSIFRDSVINIAKTQTQR